MSTHQHAKIQRPALRYHGGKFRLAPWILRFMPPHLCYVEPFGGAAGESGLWCVPVVAHQPGEQACCLKAD